MKSGVLRCQASKKSSRYINEIIDEMTVWHRYYRSTKDDLNNEFSTHYKRVIRSLLQKGKTDLTKIFYTALEHIPVIKKFIEEQL